MRYQDVIAELYALRARGVRMGVARMQAALRHRRFDSRVQPYVIVAGTNGKGSVSAMIAAGLQAAGFRTGLFTSPHLHRFTERIRVDGKPIGTREAARRGAELLADFAGERAPDVTFFELSTLMALEVFRDHDCDIAVLEVGLGGRLDATNALPAVLGVITHIALDHQEYLGNTLAEIAGEKAGIIKRGVPVVVAAQEPAALEVIEAHAARMRAKTWVRDRDFGAELATDGVGLHVRVGGQSLGQFHVALAGEHQRGNAACAVAALHVLSERGFGVSPRAMRSGLRRVRWPARLERVAGKPELLFDAAHNPDGARALAAHLGPKPSRSRKRPRARRVLVFGAMADKDYRAMLRALGPCFDRVLYAVPALPRAASGKALSRVHPGTCANTVGGALAAAKRAAGPAGLVVVAGSIFLVAEARALLLGLPADPLIRM